MLSPYIVKFKDELKERVYATDSIENFHFLIERTLKKFPQLVMFEQKFLKDRCYVKFYSRYTKLTICTSVSINSY